MLTDQAHSINPLYLAHVKECIEDQLPLEQMERLKGLLLDYSGQLHYNLSFTIDESGRCSIESQISVVVTLACQRCLEPVAVDIQRRNLLRIVNNEAEIDSLAPSYEPLLLDDSKLLLHKFIEDELLLALPLYFLHRHEKCSGQKELERINESAKSISFAALASLKKN